jgi:hypothetical protein
MVGTWILEKAMAVCVAIFNIGVKLVKNLFYIYMIPYSEALKGQILNEKNTIFKPIFRLILVLSGLISNNRLVTTNIPLIFENPQSQILCNFLYFLGGYTGRRKSLDIVGNLSKSELLQKDDINER